MSNQLTSNAKALRLFFTEDIYLVNDEFKAASVEPVMEVKELQQKESIANLKTDSKVYEEQFLDSALVQEPNVEDQPKLDFKYLGKNQRKILILVNDNENEVSTEQGKELLRKLLNAIALTTKDFALVNYANYNTANFKDFNDFFECKLVLAFGVNAKQLVLAEQPLHELKKLGETKFVFTSNLNDLDSDQTSKKILWSSLQKLK